MLQNSQIWLVITWSANFESRLMPRSVSDHQKVLTVNGDEQIAGYAYDYSQVVPWVVHEW